MAPRVSVQPNTERLTRQRIRTYRGGGEGFIQWCEDNVCVSIYRVSSDVSEWVRMGELPDEINPETGKSYRLIWEEQKKELRRALAMRDGRFLHRQVVLCWPRGEGKSFVVCLIQLWKFFCWPKQQIMLGANSKDQVKFVHFDIMRDIILNSPNLLTFIGGKKNIKEKEIRMVDSKGNLVSLIRAISSFSGIVSNITGYTFSEIFDMKNPKFYVQLDGSIRNIPNAIGAIDSTVSAKDHVLYRLYRAFVEQKDPTLYFSYRYAARGKSSEYWNPYMTDSQLDSYRIKFPMGEFERYFQNLWSAGAKRVFPEEAIIAMNYLGTDGHYGNNRMLRKQITRHISIIENLQVMEDNGLEPPTETLMQAEEVKSNWIPVDSVYDMRGPSGRCSIQALEELSDIYDTDWAILAGFDRSDPMTKKKNARTIYTVVAKGLAGSRSREFKEIREDESPRYIYFLLRLVQVEPNSIEVMKELISEDMAEYDGVDIICSERWGMWDLSTWCEDNDISFEAVYPTYDRQRSAFAELYTIVNDGRFKTPIVWTPGSVSDDVLKEEMRIFDHDPEKKWFGSPEKDDHNGIQDDSMYSLAWTIFGGVGIGLEMFRRRASSFLFGQIYQNTGLLGKY